MRFAVAAATAVIGLAAILSGCAHQAAPPPTPQASEPPPPPKAAPPKAVSDCPKDGQRATAELVFGRSSDDPAFPSVSESDFTSFLDEEVTPRFPDGLTVVDAQGRWSTPAGAAVHEQSKMVMIVLPGRADDHAKLDAVRDAYKKRYHQESVLLMTHGDCVSF
jgi:hypothetical protein